MEELIKELLQLKEVCEKSGKDFSKVLRHNKELSLKVENITSFLPSSVRNSERVFCILNKITEPILCKTCHIEPVPFNYKTKNSYRTFCSSKCGSNDPGVLEKRKSNRDEYVINKKREETIALSNNGIRNFSQTQEGRNILRESKLADYADPVKKISILKKFKQSSIEKFGTDNPAQADSCKEKSKLTSLQNWGVGSYLQTPECRELSAQSLLNPEAKLHKIETVKQRYGGIDNTFKLPISIENRKRTQFLNLLNSFRLEEAQPLFTYDEYKGVGRDYEYLFRCRKCTNVFKSHLDWGHTPRCLVCKPLMFYKSHFEDEIYDWLKSLKIEKVFRNDRTVLKEGRKHAKELDFYIPEHALAIEFNGLWAHSEQEGNKDRWYHLNKTNLCKDKGIQLIHIFEDEWVNKPEVVKSIIKYRLGLIDRKIPAKDCIVKKIDKEVILDFLIKNHLDSPIKRGYNLGLFLKDELVYVLSLGKPRQDKKYDFEIYRSCGKINTVVAGGFSKLFKYAIEELNPNSILSYVNRRYFTGGGYSDWALIEESKPDYDYVNLKFGIREYKGKYRLEKIKKKFPEFYTDGQSEREIMESITFLNSKRRMFDRIWNCGLLKFEYKPKGKE